MTKTTQPATPEPPAIEVRNLTKEFRRAGGSLIRPVDDVSFSVAAGEMVVLLGPSGCGKTTLLRCIAGLERPDDGEIVINGRVVFSSREKVFLPADRRRISMIFQSFALWPHMTVFKNVAYPLETQRMPAADIRRRVLEVLEMVGIQGLEEQHPGRISGGQQQRVALARALVSNSTVVLFDEPLSNVDAQVRAQLRFELKRMQRRIGFSGLYVTHDQSEAMELGHRVAVFQSGRIAALADPRTVYEEPPTEYVANFIGTANVWPGTVIGTEAGGRLRVDTPIGVISAGRVSGDVSVVPKQAVSVVVRPERVSLSLEEPIREVNRAQVTIEARIFAGSHTEYVVQKDSAVIRVWSHDDTHLRGAEEGATAWLSLDPARIQVIAAAKA